MLLPLLSGSYFHIFKQFVYIVIPLSLTFRHALLPTLLPPFLILPIRFNIIFHREIINICIILLAEPSNILFYILSYVVFCLSWSFYCLIFFVCLICYVRHIHLFQLFQHIYSFQSHFFLKNSHLESSCLNVDHSFHPESSLCCCPGLNPLLPGCHIFFRELPLVLLHSLQVTF